MVIQTISKSPVGVSNAHITPAGLAASLLGLPDKAQARAEGNRAIACGLGLVAIGALILMMNSD
jgi:hypothetical protein